MPLSLPLNQRYTFDPRLQIRIAHVCTHLGVLSWDTTANLYVLKNNHGIMYNVRAMKAFIVTYIHYAWSFMCFMNEQYSKDTS